MTVSVRQATRSDRERLGHFLAEAYGDRAPFKFPERWTWEYVNNPFWHGDQLPIWIAESEGEIVGQTCIMAVPLKLGDRVYPAALGTDFVVHEAHRGKGIGGLLQQSQVEQHPIRLVVALAPISRKILASLGYVEIEPVVELYKTVRWTPGEVLDILEKRPGAARLLARASRRLRLGPALALAFDLSHRPRSRRPGPGARGPVIEPVERFGAEMDHLWDSVAPRFRAAVPRTAEYLNWKFLDQPNMHYKAFVGRQAGSICGYVIVRTCRPPEPEMGVIADLLAQPGDGSALPTLLAHAVEHLRGNGVKAIVAASSDPETIAQFSRLGFNETRRLVPIFRCRDTDHDLDYWRTGWFLSMGDHDWDQFPLS